LEKKISNFKCNKVSVLIILVLVPQPPILGDGVSEVVLSLSYQRGKNLKKTKQNKNSTKCPKFKCNTISVSFSACRCSSVVVSSKEERKKKESGDRSVNGCLKLWFTCQLLSACCCCRLYLCRSQE
jgi:hypothetical protein